MLVADIHHVSLNVADAERAIEFYTGVLGLGPLPRPDFGFAGAWLDAGGGRQVHLIEAEPPGDRGQHVAFRVDDLDAVVATLRSRGCEVSEPSRVGDTTLRQSFAFDPDGNRLEFTQTG